MSYPAPARQGRSATRAGARPCRSGRRTTRRGSSFRRAGECLVAAPWYPRQGPGVRLVAGDVRVDGGDEAGLAKLTKHNAAESWNVKRCRSESDQRFASCLSESVPISPGDPLGQHRKRAARLLVLRQRLPLALEDRQRGRVERVARLEAGLKEFLGLLLGRRGIDGSPLGRQLRPTLEAPVGETLATFFSVFSGPRFSNSRRRITSLISASSLTRSGLATAPMTFTILSCHCRSQSVISTWLRGRLITAAGDCSRRSPARCSAERRASARPNPGVD